MLPHSGSCNSHWLSDGPHMLLHSDSCNSHWLSDGPHMLPHSGSCNSHWLYDGPHLRVSPDFSYVAVRSISPMLIFMSHLSVWHAIYVLQSYEIILKYVLHIQENNLLSSFFVFLLPLIILSCVLPSVCSLSSCIRFLLPRSFIFSSMESPFFLQ